MKSDTSVDNNAENLVVDGVLNILTNNTAPCGHAVGAPVSLTPSPLLATFTPM